MQEIYLEEEEHKEETTEHHSAIDLTSSAGIVHTSSVVKISRTGEIPREDRYDSVDAFDKMNIVADVYIQKNDKSPLTLQEKKVKPISTAVKTIPQAPIARRELSVQTSHKTSNQLSALTAISNRPKEIPKEAITVKFTGLFGSIDAPYLEVYEDGDFLILISDSNSTFKFSPPKIEDPIQIIVNNKDYEVYAPGINFTLPDNGNRITVLLIIINED